MVSLILRFAFVLGLIAGFAAPAPAADKVADKVTVGHDVRISSLTGLPQRALPFPRSKREQSVWASDACWNGSQDYCTWGLASCIERDAQGLCLKYTDHCDRVSQRRCRTWGGPLVPDIFDF
jgi:hypothetical protein